MVESQNVQLKNKLSAATSQLEASDRQCSRERTVAAKALAESEKKYSTKLREADKYKKFFERQRAEFEELKASSEATVSKLRQEILEEKQKQTSGDYDELVEQLAALKQERQEHWNQTDAENETSRRLVDSLKSLETLFREECGLVDGVDGVPGTADCIRELVGSRRGRSQNGPALSRFVELMNNLGSVKSVDQYFIEQDQYKEEVTTANRRATQVNKLMKNELTAGWGLPVVTRGQIKKRLIRKSLEMVDDPDLKTLPITTLSAQYKDAFKPNMGQDAPEKRVTALLQSLAVGGNAYHALRDLEKNERWDMSEMHTIDDVTSRFCIVRLHSLVHHAMVWHQRISCDGGIVWCYRCLTIRDC